MNFSVAFSGDFSVVKEAWPIAGEGFVISRETKKDALVVTVSLTRGGRTGQGEGAPLRRYHHTQNSVAAEIDAWLQGGYPWTRDTLLETMKAGPARFALDTALWMLEAAERHQSFAEYAGITAREWPTAFTISGGAPDTMADAALAHQKFCWLKIKLMGDGLDAERLYAIHSQVSEKELIVDANEALTPEDLTDLLPVFEFCNVVLVEQPLPAGKDEALRGFKSPIPFAADESCHTIDDLEGLVGKYQVVNLKLDKTGGLTHALQMKKRARELGFDVMLGCMASTGLSLLPACAAAEGCTYLDLDGALLLVKDRPDSKISYRDGKVCLLDSEE